MVLCSKLLRFLLLFVPSNCTSHKQRKMRAASLIKVNQPIEIDHAVQIYLLRYHFRLGDFSTTSAYCRCLFDVCLKSGAIVRLFVVGLLVTQFDLDGHDNNKNEKCSHDPDEALFAFIVCNC